MNTVDGRGAALTAPRFVVDDDSPWPGLSPFGEGEQNFFFGRDLEIGELCRLVRRETLSVLFAQSGAGKTSLVCAGLLPELRKTDYLPVYVRLDHDEGSEPLEQQIKDALHEVIATEKVDAPPAARDQTLWEYFHSRDLDFWSAQNRLLTPILIFDQFEEIFTLGRGTRAQEARVARLLAELESLVEARPPTEVQARLDAGTQPASAFNFDKRRVLILLCLREDYLPELEALRDRFHAISQNRLRLEPLNGQQALAAVLGPARRAQLMEESTARSIVGFLAGREEESRSAPPTDTELAGFQIEPSLLSLVCFELNNRRQREHLAAITPALLSGTKQEILGDFYRRGVEGLPEPVCAFIEENLLTGRGFRQAAAEEDFLAVPGASREILQGLVRKRLIRREEGRRFPVIELTHDVLAKVVIEQRGRRRESLRQRELALVRKQVRSRGVLVAVFAGVSALALVAAVWAVLSQRQATRSQQQELRKEREALRNEQLATKNLERAKLAEADRAIQFEKAQNLNSKLIEVNRDLTNQTIALIQATNQLAQQNRDLAKLTGDLSATLAEAKRQQSAAEAASQKATASELQRRRTLFQSYLDQARAAANIEDYAAAKTAIAKSRDRSLVAEINPTLLSARDLLSAYVNLQGADAVQTNEARVPLRGIAATVDGRWVAVVGEEGKGVLFDREQNKASGLPSHHTDTITCVALDQKHEALITAGTDRYVFLSPLSADGPTKQWRCPGSVVALAVNHNGELLAVGGPDYSVQAKALDGNEAFEALPEAPTNVTCLAFSPDDRLLACTTGDGLLCVWALEPPDARGLRRARQPRWLRKYISTGLEAVAFSPRGTELATGSADGSIEIWDLTKGARQSLLQGHYKKVSSLAYSPRGELLVSASWDLTLRIWDLASRTTTKVLQGHGSAVTGVSVAEDRIFSCSVDGTWRTWLIGDGAQDLQRQRVSFHPQRPTCCALSPDATLAAVGLENGEVQCWSLREGTNKWTHSNAHSAKSVTRLAFSPDGTRLASVGFDGSIKLWEAATGLALFQDSNHLGEINDVAFSQDGGQLAAAGVGGQATLSRNSHLVGTSTEGRMLLLDMDWRRRRVLRMPGEALSVVFDPSGQTLFAAGADGSTLLWNLQTAQPSPVEVFRAEGDTASWTAISHNGKLVATAYRSGAIEVATNAPPYRPYCRLRGHEDAIVRLAFSPDEQQLLTASADRTLRAWDLQAQNQLFSLRLPAPDEDTRPLWDFAFLGKDTLRGEAWLAVPLTRGELVIYRLGKIYF